MSQLQAESLVLTFLKNDFQMNDVNGDGILRSNELSGFEDKMNRLATIFGESSTYCRFIREAKNSLIDNSIYRVAALYEEDDTDLAIGLSRGISLEDIDVLETLNASGTNLEEAEDFIEERVTIQLILDALG